MEENDVRSDITVKNDGIIGVIFKIIVVLAINN